MSILEHELLQHYFGKDGCKLLGSSLDQHVDKNGYFKQFFHIYIGSAADIKNISDELTISVNNPGSEVYYVLGTRDWGELSIGSMSQDERDIMSQTYWKRFPYNGQIKINLDKYYTSTIYNGYPPHIYLTFDAINEGINKSSLPLTITLDNGYQAENTNDVTKWTVGGTFGSLTYREDDSQWKTLPKDNNMSVPKFASKFVPKFDFKYAVRSIGNLRLYNTAEGDCYKEMFANKSIGSTQPIFPANHIKDTSCVGMFKNTDIASFTFPQNLIIESGSINNMFEGCKNLHTVNMNVMYPDNITGHWSGNNEWETFKNCKSLSNVNIRLEPIDEDNNNCNSDAYYYLWSYIDNNMSNNFRLFSMDYPYDMNQTIKLNINGIQVEYEDDDDDEDEKKKKYYSQVVGVLAKRLMSIDSWTPIGMNTITYRVPGYLGEDRYTFYQNVICTNNDTIIHGYERSVLTIINPTTFSGQDGVTFYYPEDGDDRESLIKSYSLNGGPWMKFDHGDTFTLNKGDVVYLSGSIASDTSQNVGTTSKIFVKNITSTSKKLIVKGNIASLFYGSDEDQNNRNDTHFLNMYVHNNEIYKNPTYIGTAHLGNECHNADVKTIQLTKDGVTISYSPGKGEVVYNVDDNKFYICSYYSYGGKYGHCWLVYNFPNNLTLESLFGFDGTACKLEVGKDAEVFFPPSFN